MDSLALLPFPFYLCAFALLIFSWEAWQSRDAGWGVPMLAVLGTVAAWYLGDPLYNGYKEYLTKFGVERMNVAWWEVMIFLVSFRILTPVMNRKINGELVLGGSSIFQAIRSGLIDTETFQNQITVITRLLVIPWGIMMAWALFRTDFDFMGLFCPYLVEKADPWSRDRVGASSLDFLSAFAGYLQSMLTALFGVLLALSKRFQTMLLAAGIYLLAVPFYIFDRTRNVMLAVLLPGFMALVTLRMRGGIMIRLAVIIIGFMALDGWMKFVIDNRDKVTITEAFKSGGDHSLEIKNRKQLGFNMFEELGYINMFIDKGTYQVNWGARYFAEAVNPIPRFIWPGKPLIGIDYAIARGMAYGNQSSSSGGVAASISTGMIGQGVVNFGAFFGPIAAAFLMAVWVAVLAHQDYKGSDIFHMLLYAIGLVLTFNMGRDITLLVIYPFLFGWLMLNAYNRYIKKPV
jgi:hypothetical protein